MMADGKQTCRLQKKGESTMRRRNGCAGGYCAAFGAGVLLAILFPTRLILILAAAALVLTGISLIRCR